MSSTDTFTRQRGDLVRVRGWGNMVFRIVRINIVAGETVLWGGDGYASRRTVSSDRIVPARPGDEARAPRSNPKGRS